MPFYDVKRRTGASLTDIYDALISRRVYKEPMSHEEAVEIITAGYGQHFDPGIVDAFLAVQTTFQAIAEQFTDPD